MYCNLVMLLMERRWKLLEQKNEGKQPKAHTALEYLTVSVLTLVLNGQLKTARKIQSLAGWQASSYHPLNFYTHYLPFTTPRTA